MQEHSDEYQGQPAHWKGSTLPSLIIRRWKLPFHYFRHIFLGITAVVTRVCRLVVRYLQRLRLAGFLNYRVVVPYYNSLICCVVAKLDSSVRDLRRAGLSLFPVLLRSRRRITLR